jgi:regulator of sirC expression with transglutaminase-like and TPR domain
MQDGSRYDAESDSYIIEGSLFDYEVPQEQPAFNSPLGRLSRMANLPDAEIDLAEAALIIAGLEYPGLSEVYYLDLLDDLADEARPLFAAETDPLKYIEQLNYFLFNLKGFRGNETDYNDRRNSYLNDVLERRTGIPITLSLLYMEIGKRLGLHFEGIGLPGHFIVRYRELATQSVERGDSFSATADGFDLYGAFDRPRSRERGDILIDPFNGGTILTEEDCANLVRERYGRAVPVQAAISQPVTNRQLLTRMLNNLKINCLNEGDFDRALQMEEVLVVLNPDAPEERRDRGLLHLKNGRMGRAISDLQYYLRQNPQARDASAVRNQLSLAFDEMVKRN